MKTRPIAIGLPLWWDRRRAPDEPATDPCAGARPGLRQQPAIAHERADRRDLTTVERAGHHVGTIAVGDRTAVAGTDAGGVHLPRRVRWQQPEARVGTPLARVRVIAWARRRLRSAEACSRSRPGSPGRSGSAA